MEALSTQRTRRTLRIQEHIVLLRFRRLLRGNAFSWYFQFPFESVI
jgi:hypothetical protein